MLKRKRPVSERDFDMELLTPQQQELVRMLAAGASIPGIARERRESVQTWKARWRRVREIAQR